MHKIVFAFLTSLSLGALEAKAYFLLGYGTSLSPDGLLANVQNQIGKDNIKGDIQSANYKGAINNINDFYVGAQLDLDKAKIFNLRGLVNFSFANNGYFQNATNRTHTKGATGYTPAKAPTVNSDGTTTFTEEKFASVPLTPDSLPKNMFLVNYGVSADAGINLPITYILNAFIAKLPKLPPILIGAYGGLGFEFSSLSTGAFDPGVYNNVGVDSKDSIYLAGGDFLVRFGGSVRLGENLRVDLGIKVPFADIQGERYYQFPLGETDTFKQQILTQKFLIKQTPFWQVSVNALF
ncbi:hypothetical protein BKH43_07980 [Helicobacter sp. 13S00401-1]|uniref:hypothetical protein n=1 Tax=Helicobacter sp. 13S00401-1 TaxID=1905758 RepID=UPI000BA69759|nr:hypothetical protein [Helicobacter sp. 13S00401-1]PAF48214.1 hypothetical protein BKH43_07980 [Helicobacter sp. 13S00401-1]